MVPCPVCGADLTDKAQRFGPCLSDDGQHRYRDEDVPEIAAAIERDGGVVAVWTKE